MRNTAWLGCVVLFSFVVGGLLSGCGGGVHVPMGQVPNTPQVGDTIGRNAVRLGCAGRPRRGRYQVRCPGILHPDQYLFMVIYDDASMECVAPEGYTDDCGPLFTQLTGYPAPAYTAPTQ